MAEQLTSPQWAEVDRGLGIDPLEGSWCPGCGPDVEVYEDGCCGCGADARGPGANEVHLWRLRARSLAEHLIPILLRRRQAAAIRVALDGNADGVLP
ncbi:MAG: hypothetical protein GY719_26120 [bacterium]|nr:hypothetical protein [bacterium]